MKPLEFKIEKEDEDFLFKITFFYDDGSTDECYTHNLSKGLELNKHYSITDIYGYTVIDDRKGL